MPIQTVRRIEELGGSGTPLTLAIGVFDGLHLGHRRVLTEALAAARRLEGEAWVLTFDPHPMQVIAPGKAPPLLTSLPHKVRLLEQLGIAGCVLLRFDEALRSMAAETFFARLAAVRRLRKLVVGSNWTFGRGRQGTPSLLLRLANPGGTDVTVVDPVLVDGTPVSSTRLRKAVMEGRLDTARALLGRPYSLFGRVMRGRGIGRTLGYPTLNLDTENEARPPPGVYAARAGAATGLFDAAAYIGRRPTFLPEEQDGEVVEAHLLNAGQPDLYGATMELYFIARIREERRFARPADLTAQIADDLRAVRDRLAVADSGSGI